MYTVGSLFSGIGGIDLAFDRAGFSIQWQVEIDEYCCQILARHWPNVQRWRDVRTATSADLTRVDVLVGGFPCQDISTAGGMAGITDDTRSGLWFQFERLIGELRPRAVLLENVSAIIARKKTKEGGYRPADGFTVLRGLTRLGYDAEWGVIRASDAGAPHPRERWFTVAYPSSIGDQRDGRTMGGTAQETRESDVWPFPRSGSENVGDSDSVGLQGQRALWEQGTPAGSRKAQPESASYGAGQQRSTQSIMGRVAHGLPSGVDVTRWPAPRGSVQYSWEPPRVIGKRPYNKERRKAIGNAVVPQVIYPIAVSIRDWLQAQDEAAR